MVNITFTFPTRGRSRFIPAFFRNIAGTLENPETVEIIIQYDVDDTATQRSLEEQRMEYPSLPVKVIPRVRGTNLNDHYNNWLVYNKIYKGKYFWVGGDDLRILTPGWDRIIPQTIENYLRDKPDRICCAFPIDKSINKPPKPFEWGWFPILTRETIDVLGFFFPKEMATWGADVVLADIFNDPRINRSLPIRDVIVDHIGYHAYDMPKDEIAHSMSKRFSETMSTSNAYRKTLIEHDKGIIQDAIRRMGARAPV